MSPGQASKLQIAPPQVNMAGKLANGRATAAGSRQWAGRGSYCAYLARCTPSAVSSHHPSLELAAMDDEAVDCPLCCTSMDLTDRSIQYCYCGCEPGPAAACWRCRQVAAGGGGGQSCSCARAAALPGRAGRSRRGMLAIFACGAAAAPWQRV